MEYWNIMLKTDEKDQMKTLFKKLMIKRALKNNFEEKSIKANQLNDKKNQDNEKSLKSCNYSVEAIR